MSMNPDIRAASLPVSDTLLNKIRHELDVFTRNDLSDEIILDTCGFTGEEPAIVELAEMTGADPESLCDQYLILIHDDDLDGEQATRTRIFNVSVRRVAYSENTFAVKAASELEAEEKALMIAPDYHFSNDSSDYTVEMCEQQDAPAL